MANNMSDIELLAGLNINSSEQEILKAIKILQGRIKGNKNTNIKLKATIDTKTVVDSINKLEKIINSKKFNININQSFAELQKNAEKIKIGADSKNIITSIRNAQIQAQKAVKRNPIVIGFNFKKDKLINDIRILGQQNSKIFNDANMTEKYNSLLDNAKFATSSREIRNLRLQLSAMRSEIRATNLNGLTLGDTLKKTFKRATELFTGTGAVMLLVQQMKQAWTEAMNLDKAYTDLIKVQDELTRGDYPEYLSQCNKKAQELATTQQSLIEGATEFSKSGYDLTTSNKLTEQSTILSNVGEMNASDSAKAIISGVQAYEDVHGYTDTIDKAKALIDSYNAIGNTASITTAEIAQGVQTVGSVFADANTSVDEFIALLAAGNRQFQNSDTLALSLRTSALRIRGCTTQLSQMGEETEGVITSTSKLEEKIKGLTNVNGSGGVEILEADGETFRSIYDIFLDISKVYQQMSDTDQSALLELIAGKHRSSGISAVLNNMSEAQEIYQRSLESAGSAQEEYDKFMQGSEASLNQFKASMIETYQSVIDGSTVKGILDCGNATLQFVNSLGLVESSLKGLVAIGIVKAVTRLSTALKASAIQASNFGTALNTVKSMSNLARGTTEYANALQTLKTVSASLSETQLKQVLASKALSDSDRIAILRTTGLTKAQAKAKLAQMRLTQSTKSQTVAQKLATVSTFSLTAAVKGFFASCKAAFMNNPVGIAIMALSTIIGSVSAKISDYNEEVKETRQANIDAATSAKDKADSLRELYVQYEALNSIANKTLSQEEQFEQVVQDITKALGDKASALEGLTSGTDEYTEALRDATQAELENYYSTAVTGRKAAEEELQKSAYSTWDGSHVTIQMNTQMTGVENHVKALETIRDLMSEFEDEGNNGKEWEPINWDKDHNDMDALVNYYNALIEARKQLVLESQATNDESLLDTDLYKDINSTITLLSENIQAYTDKKYEEMKLEYEMQNGIPKTVEEYKKMRKALLDSTEAGKYFDNSIKAMLDNDFADLTQGLQNVKDAQNDIASTDISLFSSFSDTGFGDRIQHITDLFNKGLLSHKEYFDALQSEINNFDASNFTDSVEDMNKASEQFFVDSVQQTADGLSDLINKFDSGEMSISEYLEGYLAIGDTLSTLTDSLQENSDAWNKNGEAISNAENTALDDTQSSLNNAMATIESYQDSIYSLEQIMTGAVTAGSDEFNAHANVIAQDLANIVANGGAMADEVANTLGTTTAEIAQNMAGNVSNQEIACQAIMANTNSAITNMATAIGTLFDTLGNAISNFKVDVSFGVKSIDWKKVDVLGNELKLPEIKFELGASGKSLKSIGNAISSFGKAVVSNYTPQTINLDDFYFGNSDAAKNRNYTPGSNVTKNYEDALNKAKSAGKSAGDSAKDSAEKTMEEIQKEWKEYLDKYLALYKAELDAGLIDFNTFLNKSRALLDEYYRDGKISAKDYWDSVKALYEDQLSIYDKVIAAVTNRIEKEIDLYQDQQEEIEERYQTEIDYLDTVIKYYEDQKKALQDTNDEKDRQLALEQALYNLQRAQTQRTLKLYTSSRGFIYTVDNNAIRDASEEVAKAKLDIEIAKLDESIEKVKQQQEALQDAMDKEKKQLQKIIDSLEEYKDQWQSVSGEYEDAQNELLAAQILGADWEKNILDGRIQTLTDFKNQYLAIQKEIADAALAAAQADVNQTGQSGQWIQDGGRWWYRHGDGSYTTNGWEQIDGKWYHFDNEGWMDANKWIDDTAKDGNWYYVGSDGAMLANTTTPDGYQVGSNGAWIQNGGTSSGTSYGTSSGTSAGTASSSNQNTLAVGKVVTWAKDSPYYVSRNGSWEYAGKTDSHYQHGFVVTGFDDYFVWGKNANGNTVRIERKNVYVTDKTSAYATGTKNAKKGLNLVGENGTEAYFDNDGNVSLVTEPTLIPMEGGETVKNATETKKLLNPDNLVPLDGITFGKGDKAVHFTQDEWAKKLQSVMPSFASMVQIPKFEMPKNDFVVNRNETTPVVQNINLTLPNVTNDSGYERLKMELKQMQIDAYQFAHRR